MAEEKKTETDPRTGEKIGKPVDPSGYTGLDEETIKRNTEATEKFTGTVPVPTQGQVDRQVTGRYKGVDEDEIPQPKTEKKDVTADKPATNYQTRTVKPAAEKSE